MIRIVDIVRNGCDVDATFVMMTLLMLLWIWFIVVNTFGVFVFLIISVMLTYRRRFWCWFLWLFCTIQSFMVVVFTRTIHSGRCGNVIDSCSTFFAFPKEVLCVHPWRSLLIHPWRLITVFVVVPFRFGSFHLVIISFYFLYLLFLLAFLFLWC